MNLDDELIRQARELTGIQDKTALIHAALRELISRGAARRLATLGGTMPNFESGRRRRYSSVCDSAAVDYGSGVG